MTKGSKVLGILSGLCLTLSTLAHGDATVFWNFDDGFAPSSVVIGPGETVVWWNVDVYGFDAEVTFDNNFSFQLPYLRGQGVIFPAQTGTYNYHSDWGQSGSVVVNVAPLVNITNPLNNAVFSAPAAFTIQATATDTADDAIAQVEFFIGNSEGTNSIGIAYNAPYEVAVSDLVAGSYTLLAIATDTHGGQATSATAITVGGGVVIQLTAPRFSAGKFLFNVSGLGIGKTNMLMVSTNLSLWKPARTNVADSATAIFTNTPTPGAQFYRILQLP